MESDYSIGVFFDGLTGAEIHEQKKNKIKHPANYKFRACVFMPSRLDGRCHKFKYFNSDESKTVMARLTKNGTKMEVWYPKGANEETILKEFKYARDNICFACGTGAFNKGIGG